MGDYKLVYFKVRGLGEEIHLLLSDQGVQYVDDQVEFDKWPEVKAKMQFGQV